MNSRERIRKIISGKEADRCGFWLGSPHDATWPILHKYFGTSTQEELRLKLGDDFRWFSSHMFTSTYQHPHNKGMFDIGIKQSHGTGGPFADAASIDDVDFEWPSVKYLHFDEWLEALRNAGPYYRASGLWTPFYHHVMDLFGMESYMINMYANPKIVHDVTNRVCEFYYEANEKFYALAGDLVDGFFFGNDFGTQLGLICGPVQFNEFILPWFAKFTKQAHDHGYQVILHSCGAIHDVIGRLIDLGVDCLHPLQANARNMGADTLAKDFKGKIAFMGGIDTQDLLVNATPEQVKTEVRRVKKALGPCLIVSPSHEALLPDVPPENAEAMAQAALEPLVKT
jgi:uroporphyrinogen decarboxylase